MIIAAWAVPVLVLIGCGAYALRGHGFRVRWIRYHLTRRRYARRMRGPLPDHDQHIPYDRQAWLTVLDAWEAPAARPEKSRT